jgi:hypothetical protein
MSNVRPHFDKSSCPAGWEITRALSEPNAVADVVRHLRVCPACAQLAADLRVITSAASELPPVAPMSPVTRERIHRALSMANAEAMPPSHRRPRLRLAWAFAGGLAAVAFVLGSWLYLVQHPEPRVARRSGQAADVTGKATSLAKLRAFGNAKFRRISGPPDEIVRVESGRIAIEVTHLASAQRFRVITDHGEVEVRGTRFEVEVRDRELCAVFVTEGEVEVRVGDSVLRLQPGDEWQRRQSPPAAQEPGQARAAPINPAAVPGPWRGREPSGWRARVLAVPSDPAKPTPQGRNKETFDLAWAHLRRGDWNEAIRSFAEVAAQSDGGALQEDALYWQAVATARAGRSQAACRLFESFLQRFPAGDRAGAATLALAWLRFDAGETDEARLLFESAARDSSAKVREGADEGLRRLKPR